MSEYFNGSIVLTQNTTGHSFMRSKSACTIGHVAAYMASAKLPPPNTTCHSDVSNLKYYVRLGHVLIFIQ